MSSSGVWGPVLAACCGLVVGCKSDCDVACEAAQDCPDVPAYFAAVDCGDLCSLNEDAAEALSCEAQFDDYMACTADNSDKVCTSSDACAAETKRWGDCIEQD